MINIMLVAGSSSANLAKFLEQRGTFEVEFVYNDLRSNAEVLMNQIIKVDKLVYIYRISENTGEAEMNIRLDMQTLHDLIRMNSFFSADEILFLCGDGREYQMPKKYFTTVMQECGVKNSDIRVLDSDASFSSIYDNLIGMSLAKDFKNTYRPLYRKERGQSSIIAFEKRDDTKLVIEPLSYSNLKNWDEQKELSKSIEQSTPLTDPEDDVRDKWFSPNFAGIASDDVLRDGVLTVVSGDKGTGKSVWALALADSAIKIDRRVCVYDFTKNQDVAALRDSEGVALADVSPFDMMSVQVCREDKLCSLGDSSVLADFLRFVIAQRFKIFNSIIVITEKKDFSRVCSLLRNLITSVVVTVQPRSYDVRCMANELSGIDFVSKVVVMAEDTKGLSTVDAMSAEDIKEAIVGSQVVKPYVFKAVSQLPWLYERLILGGDKK